MTLKAWFVTVATFFLVCVSAVAALPAEAATAPQFTGTQLWYALLPASYFGPGVSLWKDSNYYSTHLEHGPAKYSLATSNCSDFYDQATGWGETAMAQNTIGNKKETVWYTQAVYQFSSPTAAATFVHGSYGAFHRCATTVLSGSPTIRFTTQSISYGRVGSFQSFTDDQSNTITGSGSTTLNRFHYLYVLDGTDVYEVIPSSTTTPNASVAVPAFNALRSRVGRL
jgi:hypothetical protein